MKMITLKIALYFLSLFCVMFARPYTSTMLCALTYFFAFALFFYSVSNISRRSSRFYIATFYFFLVQLFQIRWLANTYYQGLGIIFVYIILSLLIAFSFALVVAITPSKRPLRLYEILALCSFWALLEYTRVFFFSGFTFNPLALFTFFSRDLIQLASLFGVYFLSFMVLFTNFFAYNFFLQKNISRFCLFLCAALLPIFIGKAVSGFSDQKKIKSIHTVLMQPALMSEEKWEMQGFNKPLISQLDQIRWVVDELKKYKPETLDVVVLPEVALSGDAYEPSMPLDEVLKILPFSLKRCAPLIKELAEKRNGRWFVSNSWVCHCISNYFKLDLMIGLSDYDYKKKLSYNAFFLFKPASLKAQKHIKRVLIPLTEYLPFQWLTKFMKTFGIEEFYQKGEKNSVLRASFANIAPVICIEEGYSDLVKKSVQNGADLIVSINNDVWFPFTTLSYEHLYLGALRAIENGVFVLRSSNTGISAIINPQGDITHLLDELNPSGGYQKGSLGIELNLTKKSTLYNLFFLPVDKIIFLFFIFYGCVKTLLQARVVKKSLKKNLLL